MAVNINLNAAGLFSVCGGYPIRLLKAGESMLSGVIPVGITSVSAVVQTETGTATVHLGLFTMPTTQTGSDNAMVAQTDAAGVTTQPQTVSVAVPTGVAPVPYVVRLWVDSITGSNVETISRDGSTAAASLPPVPTAVKVVSVSVA